MIHPANLFFPRPAVRNHLTSRCSNARRTRWRLPFITERHRYYYRERGQQPRRAFFCCKLKIEDGSRVSAPWEELQAFSRFLSVLPAIFERCLKIEIYCARGGNCSRACPNNKPRVLAACRTRLRENASPSNYTGRFERIELDLRVITR